MRAMPGDRSAEKIIAIGWDGATWDLLGPWVAAGKLPHLAGLMARGASGTLKSTPLPLSPAAWSTIITGQNPGQHGVFDWFERRPDAYEVDYVHTGRIGARPIWEYVNAGEKRIGVFNLPMVYPAVPVDGFVISGMAAPSPKAPGFTYPQALLSQIEAGVGPYMMAESHVYQYGQEESYLSSLLDSLSYQGRLARYLIENISCDVYLFVFMQSDHVQHKFWRYLDPGYPGYDLEHDHHYQESIYHIYRAMDDILSEIISVSGPDANYLLLSDHGAGPNYGVMYINRWLEQIGLLKLKSGPKTVVKTWLARGNFVLRLYRLLAAWGLGSAAQILSKPVRNKLVSSLISLEDIDWSRTRAYSRGAFGQIYLNLEGREPEGIVRPGEQAQLLIAEIIAGLQRLAHPVTGERLITEIHRREDVLHGPYVERAAEILFSIQDYAYQSSVKLGLESRQILGPSEYQDSGSHRPEGVLVAAGPGVLSGANITDASVTDILPTLLALAGLPVPLDLDGRVLDEILSAERKEQLEYASIQNDRSYIDSGAQDLSADEVAELEERLRNLGYLG